MQLLLGGGILSEIRMPGRTRTIPWKGVLMTFLSNTDCRHGSTAAPGRDKVPVTTYKGCCTSVLPGRGPTKGTAAVGRDKVLITPTKGWCTTVSYGIRFYPRYRCLRAGQGPFTTSNGWCTTVSYGIRFYPGINRFCILCHSRPGQPGDPIYIPPVRNETMMANNQ